MAFKLVVRRKLPVPVKGQLTGEDGKPVKFSFTLLCTRLNQTEIDEAMKNKDESLKDFVRKVTNGWEDMTDGNGEPLEFNDASFDELMNEAGMATVCFQSYLKEVGATAKN